MFKKFKTKKILIIIENESVTISDFEYQNSIKIKSIFLGHPRIKVSSLGGLEKEMSNLIREYYSKSNFSKFTPSPIGIIQIKDKLEGGLSEIENKVYSVLFLSSGFRKLSIINKQEKIKTEELITIIKTIK